MDNGHYIQVVDFDTRAILYIAKKCGVKNIDKIRIIDKRPSIRFPDKVWVDAIYYNDALWSGVVDC